MDSYLKYLKAFIKKHIPEIESNDFEKLFQYWDEYWPILPNDVPYKALTELLIEADVDFLKHLHTISSNMFENIDLSEDFAIPEGVSEIEPRAFSKCNIKKIFLPKSIQIIRRTSFKETPLEDIYYPGTVEEFNNVVKTSDDRNWGSKYIDDTFEGAEIHCSDGIYTYPSI